MNRKSKIERERGKDSKEKEKKKMKESKKIKQNDYKYVTNGNINRNNSQQVLSPRAKLMSRDVVFSFCLVLT